MAMFLQEWIELFLLNNVTTGFLVSKMPVIRYDK